MVALRQDWFRPRQAHWYPRLRWRGGEVEEERNRGKVKQRRWRRRRRKT